MNKNIYNDFTSSYYNYGSIFSFTNQEILEYFESIVNNDLLLNKKYNLVVTSEKENTKLYLTYDDATKTFLFNRRIFQTLFYIKNKVNNDIIFNCNYAILDVIHTIIAKIELERKINNDTFYQTNPIFYRCILEESVSNLQDDLKSNFIRIKKAQLLNNFYNICINDFGLPSYLKEELNKKLRIYLLNYDKIGILDVSNSYQNLINFCHINLFDYEALIKEKYGKDILKKYKITLNEKVLRKDSLLDSMLYSKKYTRHEKSIIKDENINILDYANKEIIDKINSKLSLKK